MAFLGTATKIGAGIGALLLIASFGMQGAPQEAALAAMAVAFTFIPYAVFRVQQITRAADERAIFEAKLLKGLERIEEAIRRES